MASISSGAALVFRYAGLVIALVGLFAAGTLSIGHLFDLPIPCGGSSGCLTVAAHPASKVMGVPIAYFGVGFFLVQVLLVSCHPTTSWARWGAIILTGMGTAVSAALLFYSRLVIHATCMWCMVSGGAMASLLVWMIARPRRAEYSRAPQPLIAWSLGVMTAIAVGIQAGRMERAAMTPAISQSRLAVLPPLELLDSAKTIGPATAPVTVIVFADFFCPACRASLSTLLSYQAANPDGVRVVYRHQPLSRISGHETSEAAAVLSELAAERGKFWEFAVALHARRGPLTSADYLAFMEQLGFDRGTIQTRMGDDRDLAYVRVHRDVALAADLEITATPTFIVRLRNNRPVAVTQRGLSRLLNSAAVASVLEESGRARLAQR